MKAWQGSLLFAIGANVLLAAIQYAQRHGPGAVATHVAIAFICFVALRSR